MTSQSPQHFLTALMSFSFLMSGACSFKKNSDAPKDIVIVEKEVETGSKDGTLGVRVKMGMTIHKYTSNIEWKIESGCKGKILKETKTSIAPQVIEVAGEHGSIQDTDLTEGDEISYTLICDKNGASTSIQSVRILVPTDLTLTGEIDLTKSEKFLDSKTKIHSIQYPRILIAKDLKMNIGSENVEITSEFVAVESGAHIYTFLNDSAGDGSGRNGGTIRISAPQGEGNLTLTLNGQNGANGKDGRDHPIEVRGAQGAVGQNATYYYDRSKMHLPCFGGGKGACQLVLCQSSAGNGGNGSPGLPGNPGQAGYDGGDTGYAEIDVNDIDFKVEISATPGKAGDGGQGGNGSLGGLPGAPGSDDQGASALAQYVKERREKHGNGKFGPAPTAKKCTGTPQPGSEGPRGTKPEAARAGLSGQTKMSRVFNPATQRFDEKRF